MDEESLKQDVPHPRAVIRARYANATPRAVILSGESVSSKQRLPAVVINFDDNIVK